MADQSNFKRCQIVGAPKSDVSVRKTAGVFDVAMSLVSKVMAAFEKERKTSSLKRNSRRTRKLSDRDSRTLKRIVWKYHKNIAPKITVEFNYYITILRT